ncbi:Mg2+ and Co2+ transporter CorA [Pseudarthrobacter sp. W1I19]|uniref:hypothetical protein n=1 Tax=Pseudarthrobacter sp. W1I19 TaxID=3042288 RepID=UPI00277FB587|nr:hypothetical protein [Pseudarthrobacter sp. W1I19]MDQ0923352.1 Mg2+ and Co2+ transporter CorA [Pseudarthrobacter sp. W1I19]
MDSPSSLALIGIVGTVVAGLFKLVTDTIKANTIAVKEMADSSRKIAEATEKGNREAKERNGHLGEQNVQITQLIVGQTDVLSDIKESSQTTADTTARVEKVLRDSAKTLTQTETDKSEAAETVKDTLAQK